MGRYGKIKKDREKKTQKFAITIGSTILIRKDGPRKSWVKAMNHLPGTIHTVTDISSFYERAVIKEAEGIWYIHEEDVIDISHIDPDTIELLKEL